MYLQGHGGKPLSPPICEHFSVLWVSEISSMWLAAPICCKSSPAWLQEANVRCHVLGNANLQYQGGTQNPCQMLTAVCPEEQWGAMAIAVVIATHVVSICVFSFWPLCPTCKQDYAENGVLVCEYLTSGAQALTGQQKAALLVVARVSCSRVDTKGDGLHCHECSFWPPWPCSQKHWRFSASICKAGIKLVSIWASLVMTTLPMVSEVICKTCPRTFKSPWARYVQLHVCYCWSRYKALQQQFTQRRLGVYIAGYRFLTVCFTCSSSFFSPHG